MAKKKETKEMREDAPQRITKEQIALGEKYYPKSNGGKYIGRQQTQKAQKTK